MIDEWLALPDPVVLLLLALFYATTAGVITAFTFGRRTRRFMLTLTGSTPSYFSCIAVLFALMTGFMANDVAIRTRQAVQAVDAEAGAAARVVALSVAAPSDMAAIRALLAAYLRSAMIDDWPEMIEGRASVTTQAALAALLRDAAAPRIAAESGTVVQAALLAAVVAIDTARGARHAAAADATSQLKWWTVLLLGVLVQAALTLAHIERPRAHAATLAIFSSAAVVALGLLALQETPFNGWMEINSMPLQRVAMELSR